jgi:hypothetical protein
VIPEIDIWRAALLMLKRHGDKALEESAARADELAVAGDDDGAATWRRIMAAVTQLANKTQPVLSTDPTILYVIIKFTSWGGAKGRLSGGFQSLRNA